MRSGSRSGDSPDDLSFRAGREVEESRKEVSRFMQGDGRLAVALRLAARVAREQAAERVGLAASGAAFWLVISAFPTAIAVVTLYGVLVSPERVATDLGNLANGVPGSLGSLLAEQLRKVADTNQAGLSVGFCASLAFAVSSASAGVKHLDGAIRAAFHLPPQRWFEARRRSFGGALVVVLLLGFGTVVLPAIVARAPAALALLGIPIALAAMTGGVSVLYRFSISTRVGVRALWPGALFSGVGVVVVTAGFGAFVAGSSRYTAVYGAFAGAVIGMLAVYLAVYVVLIGAVLNTQLGRLPDRRQPIDLK